MSWQKKILRKQGPNAYVSQMVEVEKWKMKLTPFKISVASSMKFFPLKKKTPPPGR
jgi:hypothetical protein